MPHSPDLIDSILKEAGFFDDIKSKLTGFLQSREKKRASSRVGAYFDSKDKDWDRVVSNSSRKSFVKELAGDARADDKLKMHVDSMNRLKTGKVLSTVSGTEGSRTARRDGSQSYKIVKLRGSNRLGCTCRDWRFKKSVAAQGEQADCKHIREFKQMNKTAGNTFSDNGQTYDVEKLWQIDRPGKVVDHESLLKGTGRTWGDRPNRYGWRDVLADPDKYPEEMARIENADLSYPILVRDRDDVVIDGIHRLLKARKTGQPATGVRVTPEDMQSALSKMAAHPTYAAQLSSLSRPEQMQKEAGERIDEVVGALRSLVRDPIHKEHVVAWSRHGALNTGQAANSLGRGELRDAAKESIFAVLPPTHHSREDMKGMMRNLSGKKTRHRDWYRWGRGDNIPEPSKTAAYEEGGSFTHDGQRYSLREAFRTARAKPTKQVDVDKLKWVLQYDRPNPKRLAAANLNAPVIVAPDRRGRPTVVDGLHRLSKAVQQGKKTLPAKMLTLRELKKEAGHVEDRIAERAPGSTYEVAKIEAQIPSMKLRKGQTYHVPLKRGKGYAVIGDVGPKHVIKTVLGPNMRPPGHRLVMK
jgi:hypothetical protein